MFPGPVFFHELRTVARRRRFYALRVVFGLFLVYLVFAYARPGRLYRGPWYDEGEYSFRELALIGQGLFASVIWLQAIAIILLTPPLVAGAIGEDRERKILSYLLASPLTPAEIILGKLAARLANLAILVTVALPVISIALFLGGVQPEDVWLAFGVTMSSLFFLAAVSIFVSTFSNRSREAILQAYAIGLCWLLFPAIERGIVSWGGVAAEWLVAARPVTEYLSASSPTHLIFNIFSSRGSSPTGDVLWLIGLQIAYGAALIAWSTLRLRAVEQGSRRRGIGLGGRGLLDRTRRIRERRPCGDDPMLWKECTEAFSSGGWVRAAASTVLAMAFLAVVGYWAYESAVPAFIEMNAYGYGSTNPFVSRENLNAGVRMFTGCLYPILVLFLAVTAATSFTSEKEKDTWISLVATPLEGSEIIRGKILGSIWRIRWIMAALLLVWMIGLLCGAVHPLGLLMATLVTGVYVFACAAMATYISLRSRSSVRAIATVLGIGMFCNFGYLFCCIPFAIGLGSVAYFAGVTPLIVAGAVFSFAEFDHYLRHFGDTHEVEAVFLGLISPAIYGVAGIKLLNDCHQRFEIEVDRPRRRGWARQSQAGIRFLDDEMAEGEQEPIGKEDIEQAAAESTTGPGDTEDCR